MQPRLNPQRLAPDLYAALVEFDHKVRDSGIEASLYELVKIRASQINGCAFCIDMHTRAARARGESEERLYLLDAWREAPQFSARERAALAWTEAVTLVAETRVPDDVYEEVRREFSEEEIVKLTMLIAVINAWNRIAISARSVPARKGATAAA